MPATFAHCLIATNSIDSVFNAIRTKALEGTYAPLAQILGEKNHFVVMGAAGPDYPYLSEILTTGVLKIGHSWANRMHYENVSRFVKNGIDRLATMDKKSEPFAVTLSWFCGYVSHIIADAYVHPVVNSIVNGIYMFTHKEHSKCELIQDIYIFKKEKGEDIVDSSPRDGAFGFLKILDECSDPDDESRIHPEIYTFWSEILKAAHPNAFEFFDDIDPDKWHYNYKGRVNFVVDPGVIFRHVFGMMGFSYKKEADIEQEELEKYINKVNLPNNQTDHYDNIFEATVEKVVDAWKGIFEDITHNRPDRVAEYIKDWNLDTGVDESHIDFWTKEV